MRKRRSGRQDLVGSTQLGVLLAQPDQLGIVLRAGSRRGHLAEIAPDPVPQRLLLDPEQLTDLDAAAS